MLPTRKIKYRDPKNISSTMPMNKTLKNNYSIMQYGGSETIPEKVEENQSDYQAPGILGGLAKYSESTLIQAITIAKDMILKRLNVQPAPGQTSAEVFQTVNEILDDPKTRLSFLDFAKSVADKGLTFIQVAKPVANRSINAVVEIFDEIAAKGGKSIVKISKDVATEIPVLGSIMGFIFMCDDIVKFVQSGISAFFQTGTKANEVVVNTRKDYEGATDINLARPEIRASFQETEKSVDNEKKKIIDELQEKITKLEEQIEKGKQAAPAVAPVVAPAVALQGGKNKNIRKFSKKTNRKSIKKSNKYRKIYK
jgi:hypothetical protein